MKSTDSDGGACWSKWYRTRRANLLRLSGEPPAHLCTDQLNFTVCARYADFLLKNVRISRYLSRHHPNELRKLRVLLSEFEKICQN